MRIYTLTKTDTQKSISSPIEVNTFVSHEEAHSTMIKQVFEYLQKCNFGVTIEELNSENGYEEGEVCVGYDYASIGTSTMSWEIFVTEISLREVIIGNILSYIRETYKTPARFDDILYKLANEYKDEDLNSIKDMGDFVQEHIIGEALYQNALVQLGGKTDEVSYGKILEYLNESDQFINVRCTMFNYWDLPIEEEKLEKWQRWFIGMLTICDGNKTMINLVREDIDNNQPKNDKIFQKELAKEKIEQYKDKLPKNFRELCASLDDDQYLDMLKEIVTHEFQIGDNLNDLRVVARNFYENVRYYLYTIIKKYGWDAIWADYDFFDMEFDFEEDKWVILIDEPIEEVANEIERMKIQYSNLF